MNPFIRSAFVVVIIASMAAAHATDHRDAPSATNDPAADINDVFTFINPQDPAELILAMTVTPSASRHSRFSDTAYYVFHLDNGSDSSPYSPATTSGGKRTITCWFPDAGTRVSCLNHGHPQQAEGPLDRTVVGVDMRVWAGLRDDPSFFDLHAFNRTKETGVLSFTDPGLNHFAGLNTLAIVVGIKHAQFTHGGLHPVVKVSASTRRVDRAGIGAGISGVWRDPANPGQGVILEVLDRSYASGHKRLLAYWNVFTPTGDQLNLYGVADIPEFGGGVTVPVFSGSGGRFPPALGVAVQEAFGKLTFRFDDCNNGTMEVVPTRLGYDPTTIRLSRLTQIQGVACSLSGQVDRMGRAGINLLLMDRYEDYYQQRGRQENYNLTADPLEWSDFAGDLDAAVAGIDGFDGIYTNIPVPAAEIGSLLADDRLQIDTSIAHCDTYLAKELGMPNQCGGRTLARDAIDDTLAVIIGPGVSDHVANDSIFLADFPFLGIPN